MDVAYKPNFLTVEYAHHRRGSGSFKPVKKLLAGLRAHKSSEELHKVGLNATPKTRKKNADLSSKFLPQDGLSATSTPVKQNQSYNSQGGSTNQPYGSSASHQGPAPIIQVQTASPTLERHSRPNMKKSLPDNKVPKRRKSPLSKRPQGDVPGVPSGTTRPARGTGSGGPSSITDGAWMSDGPHSLDESETADITANATMLAMATNGGSASDATGEGEDVLDNSQSQAALDEERKRAMLERLNLKLQRTLKFINEEQSAKEEHVNEYLRLSNNADKQQPQQRQMIKKLFERKNQKSTQLIAQYQKKVEGYKKKISEVEQYGVSAHKQPKEVLKDVGQGLKDMGANLKEFSGAIVSKPKELFKNKKYGSADNIHNIKLEDSQGSTDDGEKRSQHGSSTLPPQPSRSDFHSEEDGMSDVTSESASGAHSSPHATPHGTLQVSGNSSHHEEMRLRPYFEQLYKELEEQRDLTHTLQSALLEMKSENKEQLAQLNHSLEEERYRRERLEEQINDLTELHQNEVPNIRQDLASMEEKMEYKLEERTLDLHELLESCQTRLSKMEMAQQQQQLISMEGIDNSNFRALIVKLLNVVLALVGVVLVFVSTLANVLGPFLTTRFRILSTVALIACIVAVWQNWSTVKDYGSHLYQQYGHILPVR